MRTLSARHLDALSSVAGSSFEAQLATDLVERFPRLRDVPRAEVDGIVRWGVDRAAQDGLRASHDVALFVGVAATLGPGFDARPPYREQWTGTEPVVPAERLRRLADELQETHPDGAALTAWRAASNQQPATAPNDPVLRCSPLSVNRRRVLVVALPGIMGTRLNFTKGGVWATDKKLKMIWFALADDRKARARLRYDNEATVADDLDGVTEEERARGFGGLMGENYLEFLRDLGSDRRWNFDLRVHGLGYDWRQNNRDTAATVTARVLRLLAEEKAERAIIVTHSMGGLVARWALKHSAELAAKTLGVIHLAQPVGGAPVFYRRFFIGNTLSKDGVLALSAARPQSFIAMISGVPSTFQLLPTRAYSTRGTWLTWNTSEHEKQDELYALYRGEGDHPYPPALLPRDYGTNNLRRAIAEDVERFVSDAEVFHDKLGLFAHPQTRALYTSKHTKKTDHAVVFVPTDDMKLDHRNLRNRVVSPHVQTCDEQDRQHLRDRVVSPHVRTRNEHQQHLLEVRHGAQVGETAAGDGTVPAASADLLEPKEHNLSVENVSHGGFCKEPVVREQIHKILDEFLAKL